uniref:t-SNARE coiled-coil homology domain-containing protein n=1 Tax=Panagrellus redivivus TaxID=6233 RepID=A0A7E4UW19_PANRE
MAIGFVLFVCQATEVLIPGNGIPVFLTSIQPLTQDVNICICTIPKCTPTHQWQVQRKMRDRLNELQQAVGPQTVVEMNPARIERDVTMPADQVFLVHAYELRKSLDALQKRLQKVQIMQSKVLSQPIVSTQDKIELEDLMDEIKQHIRSLKPRVKEIELDIRRDEQNGTIGTKTGAQLRIRRNQCEQLKSQLNDMMMLFSQTQSEYKSRVSKRVKRQLEMTGTKLSNQEVNQMLDSKANDVFYRQINPQSMASRQALEDATSRHREILGLEESVAELHEIFEEVLELAHRQGDIVNNIEKNVSTAVDFTESGNREIRRAIKHKQSALRRKSCMVTVIVFLLVILIVLAVVICATVT